MNLEWKKVNEKIIRDGYRKISLKTFILPDGKQKDFEIKKEGECVCVLPITADNKIILAKQFRPGPEKVLMELPGGGSGDDTPIEAAKRELLEETGYTGDFQYVATPCECAYSTIKRHAFVATNCKKVQEQNLDDSEFIEIVEMTLPEFRKHLQTGQLSDVEIGYLGLDFLGLLK